MHFLSVGALLARLEPEEEYWAVPKLPNAKFSDVTDHTC